jgi:hypothetical protein
MRCRVHQLNAKESTQCAIIVNPAAPEHHGRKFITGVENRSLSVVLLATVACKHSMSK